MSLADYKSQLSDIELLLADAPEDESLLKLKSDLVELIQLTEEQEGEEEGGGGGDNGNIEEDDDERDDQIGVTNDDNPASEENEPLNAGADHDPSIPAEDENNIETKGAAAAAAAPVKPKMSLKKSKKILSKQFEIPSHLIPLDSDTDAEKKKKKRAVRALKAQFKSTQKTAESEVKQQSWQNFNKKKKKKRKGGSESIFKTEEGVSARTGVITGSNSGKQAITTKKQRHLF